jgi:hypothetical protein
MKTTLLNPLTPMFPFFAFYQIACKTKMTSSHSSTSCDVEIAKLAETQEEECVERKDKNAIIYSQFKVFIQAEDFGLLHE